MKTLFKTNSEIVKDFRKEPVDTNIRFLYGIIGKANDINLTLAYLDDFDPNSHVFYTYYGLAFRSSKDQHVKIIGRDIAAVNLIKNYGLVEPVSVPREAWTPKIRMVILKAFIQGLLYNGSYCPQWAKGKEIFEAQGV